MICDSLLQFPDANSWLIGKDPDAGKGWGQEEKGAGVDEMLGWHHQFDGHGIGQPLGGSEGVLQSMGSQSQTWPSNWEATTIKNIWYDSY